MGEAADRMQAELEQYVKIVRVASLEEALQRRLRVWRTRVTACCFHRPVPALTCLIIMSIAAIVLKPWSVILSGQRAPMHNKSITQSILLFGPLLLDGSGDHHDLQRQFDFR